jgi:hypothetical protein
MEDTIQVRKTPDIKLKDKNGRHQIKLNLKMAFGFIPEEIIVQKVFGRSNCIFIAAVITPEMLKKEIGIVKPTKEQIKRIIKPKKI